MGMCEGGGRDKDDFYDDVAAKPQYYKARQFRCMGNRITKCSFVNDISVEDGRVGMGRGKG